MVAGSFFISLATMPIKLLHAAGYRWSLAGLTLSALVVNATATYVAVGALDRGLTGAAAAVGLSYFVLFVIVTGFALSRTLPLHRVAGHAAQIVAVFVYLTAALWTTEWLVGPGPGELIGDTLVAVAKLTMVLVALAPWFVLAEVRFGGLTGLWSVAQAAWRRFPRGGLQHG
jgi:hypothetical protein